MHVINTMAQMMAAAAGIRRSRSRIGFVPTMGALHAGHASLLEAARRDNDVAVASIFVNPLQFGPKEDFLRYPRTLERDLQYCRDERTDVVFVPSKEEIYPERFDSAVEVSGLSQLWEGKARPGHFRGVTTVVAKLLNVVQPTMLYLGQKDYQQALVLQQMTRDLGWPITVRVMPTVREPDGLAMSSRNRFLSSTQRTQATAIIRALREGRRRIDTGARAGSAVVAAMRAIIGEAKSARIDYVAVANASTLAPVSSLKRGQRIVLLAAVRIGATRLIDNALVDVP